MDIITLAIRLLLIDNLIIISQIFSRHQPFPFLYLPELYRNKSIFGN